MRGTAHFNLAQGVVATVQGIGASLRLIIIDEANHLKYQFLETHSQHKPSHSAGY